MPDAGARSLPHGPRLPVFVGFSGAAAAAPGIHASVQPGDYIVGAAQEAANLFAGLSFSGAGFSELARLYNGAGAFDDSMLLVVGGFYRPGGTLTFTGQGNHNLSASWVFRRVAAAIVAATPSGSGAATYTPSSVLAAGAKEMVVVVAGHGEASPLLSSFSIAGVPAAERFGHVSTAVGRQGALCAFGGRMLGPSLFTPVSWTMSASSDMTGCILRLVGG